MWARTSSNYVKTQGLRLGATNACGRLESLGKLVQLKLAYGGPPKLVPNTWFGSKNFYCTGYIPPIFSLGSRYLSSQAGAKSSGEEDDELNEGFSKLEISQGSNAHDNSHSEDENELVSEPELSDEEDVEHSPESELKLDAELEGGQSSSQRKSTPSVLVSMLLNERKSVHTALDKYVSEDKSLDASEISYAMLTLRKRRMYRKALQFIEWLEAKDLVDHTEQHYASRLDLIARADGLQKAERYIESIPKSFRQELVYRTLLAKCVSFNNLKKAEVVFNKIKQSSFATSPFTCNQMIILYKKNDKRKIADVLLYMDKENVKPTLKTYRILIDIKGQSGEIAGMEQIVETMKADGIEPDERTKAVLAKHYIAAALKEKAELVLKEIEGSNLKDNRAMCSVLIPLYATLGREDEVERVWKICEQNAQCCEYIAAIEAWGKLKHIEKAEAVFEKLAKTKKLSSRQYSTMLRVYADNKMLNKGKDLVRRMGDNRCRIGPLTWDALVKLYVEAGEVEKADTILHKAATEQDSRVKPLFSSYMSIMANYAKRGDVHNSEKILYSLKQAGYAGRLRPFQTLLQAYIKSKTPAYGFKERMMANNVFPNRTVSLQLSQADPFKKTEVSDLLD